MWRQYLKNPVGESLGRILDKAIEFTTSKRYYSVGDVILDLNHFITETSWHVPTGKIIKSWVGHSSLVASVAISADGQYLVSGGDSNIKLWDIASGNLQSTFASHTKQISSVAISRDGRTLASSSFDGTIKLWDLKTNQFLKTILPTSGKVYSVAFASDGRTLVSGDDSSVKTWDISTGVRSNVLTGNTTKSRVSPPSALGGVGRNSEAIEWLKATKIAN